MCSGEEIIEGRPDGFDSSNGRRFHFWLAVGISSGSQSHSHFQQRQEIATRQISAGRPRHQYVRVRDWEKALLDFTTQKARPTL
jgi:hypothetical protein